MRSLTHSSENGQIMKQDRRQFIKNAGLGLLAFNVGGVATMLSPAEARSQGIGYQVLNRAEVSLLEALGETLVPTSAEAGIAYFVDFQLGSSIRETKLAVRYLGLDMSYPEFYRLGLASVDKSSWTSFGRPFVKLAEKERVELVRRMMKDKLGDWDGAPASKFYYAVKSDGADVVYGTQKGIERLGVPYMPHIVPPSDWGE